jgi:hypothetical protein
MRRRPAPPPSAQQMIREYLGQVSVAATKVLPKGDRLLFVGRTRAAIEAQVGPLASADADDVLSALTTLGDPEVLAKRERERLYSARRRGAAAAPPALWKPPKAPRRRAAPPPPADGRHSVPGQAHRPRPWPHRGLARPDELAPALPAADAPQPDAVPVVPRQADSPEAPLSLDAPTAGPAEQVPGEPAAAEPAPGEAAAAEPAPGEAAAAEPAPGEAAAAEPAPGEGPGAEPAPGEAAAAEPAPGEGPGAEPVPAEPVPAEPVTPALADGEAEAAAPGEPGLEPGKTPPGWMRPRLAPPPAETGPQSIVPGMEQPAGTEEPPAGRRRQPPAVLAEAWALARKHPLEAVSVILLGVGGLILPFPFWLIGGLVALRSRRWDARDKWIALAGPPLVTFAVLLIRAATSPGNFFSAFYHASQHDVGLSIRAGCVLCAGYLVRRLRRGPRMRTLPPWQRPR